MRKANQPRRRGSATIEMTLVGIPLIFVLISVFEISRGMWLYHTLSYAVREATRYSMVHGYDCYVLPQTCAITVGDVARRLEYAGVGLIPGQLNATFSVREAGGTTAPIVVSTCNPLSSCFVNATNYPSAAAYRRGDFVVVSATYPFSSAISMFWPGAGRGFVFQPVTLGATSSERIQF